MHLKRNLLLLLWITILLFSSSVAAQDDKSIPPDSLKGTWIGGLYTKDGDDMKPTAILAWRIHDTDFSNNTIELTEIIESIDGTEIADPKRAKYHAEFDGQLFKLHLSDTAGQNTEINLKLNRLNGFLFLISDAVRVQQGDTQHVLSIGKVTNDTSAYIKSSEAVEVIFFEPIVGFPEINTD